MNFDSTCIIAHNDQRQPLRQNKFARGDTADKLPKNFVGPLCHVWLIRRLADFSRAFQLTMALVALYKEGVHSAGGASTLRRFHSVIYLQCP